MSDCCVSTSEQAKPKTVKRKCPSCEQLCLDVPRKTILQHIKEPWRRELSEQDYYFCRTPACVVIYFSNDDKTINQSELRTRIGIKERADDALICYCFGVNKVDAATKKEVKDFVIKQTKESNCSCETTNPSGRCCLKDFPKFK